MSELKPTEESDTIELERQKEILEPMFEKVQTPTQNDGLYEEIIGIIKYLKGDGYPYFESANKTIQNDKDLVRLIPDGKLRSALSWYLCGCGWKSCIRNIENLMLDLDIEEIQSHKPSLVEAIKIVQEAVSAKVYRLNIDSGGIVLRKPKGTVLRMSPKQLAEELER